MNINLSSLDDEQLLTLYDSLILIDLDTYPVEKAYEALTGEDIKEVLDLD